MQSAIRGLTGMCVMLWVNPGSVKGKSPALRVFALFEQGLVSFQKVFRHLLGQQMNASLRKRFWLDSPLRCAMWRAFRMIFLCLEF
jgi:hypothetical protein